MTWYEGTPPDFGEYDRVWILAELTTIFTKSKYYKCFCWYGGWNEKETPRIVRWTMIEKTERNKP